MNHSEKALRFHHMGVPVTEPRPGERYSGPFDMYTSDGINGDIHIQFHRFGPRCPLHPAIQNQVHIAFVTDDIKGYLEGKQVIMPLYEPFPGYRAAMILLDGCPVEIIETTLSEEGIWGKPHIRTVLYPDAE